LRDSYGNPALAARNVSVSLVGPISKRTVVAGANLSSLVPGSGMFRYVHVLEAREQLIVWLNVSGTTVANASVNVSAVSPSAIAFNASLQNAKVQLYGSNSLMNIAGLGIALQAPPLVGHLLEVPVLRSSYDGMLSSASGGRFGADLGLVAALELSGDTGSQSLFKGSWYGRNYSYVIPFWAPAVGAYTAALRLQHPTIQTAQVRGARVARVSERIDVKLALLYAIKVNQWTTLRIA
jgi:hypothetical protein